MSNCLWGVPHWYNDYTVWSFWDTTKSDFNKFHKVNVMGTRAPNVYSLSNITVCKTKMYFDRLVIIFNHSNTTDYKY